MIQEEKERKKNRRKYQFLNLSGFFRKKILGKKTHTRMQFC